MVVKTDGYQLHSNAMLEEETQRQQMRNEDQENR